MHLFIAHSSTFSTATPMLQIAPIYYSYTLLMVLFSGDANCCEQMHFPTEMCPLPYANQCTCDATLSHVIIFVGASLDKDDKYALFRAPFYGGKRRQRRPSYLLWLMLSDAQHVIHDMCVSMLQTANLTAPLQKTDSAWKYEYNRNSIGSG